MKAKYDAMRDDSGTPPVICVYDANAGAMSVTNDAEAVVAEVVHRFGDVPIIYRDSDGIWDALMHRGGVFTSFGALGTRDRRAAVQQVRRWAS